jgi:hypothetical protein
MLGAVSTMNSSDESTGDRLLRNLKWTRWTLPDSMRPAALKVDMVQSGGEGVAGGCCWASQIAPAYGLRDSRRPTTNLTGIRKETGIQGKLDTSPNTRVKTERHRLEDPAVPD